MDSEQRSSAGLENLPTQSQEVLQGASFMEAGHRFTLLKTPARVLEGSLFYVYPPVSVEGRSSHYLVASFGLETILGNLNYAVFLGDKDGNVLPSWPCAFDQDDFVRNGTEQPLPCGDFLIDHMD